jgi:hypothetical protein
VITEPVAIDQIVNHVAADTIAYGLMWFPNNIARLRVKSSHRSLPLTCSAHLPQQNDLRNFLMSEECLELGELVANMS